MVVFRLRHFNSNSMPINWFAANGCLESFKNVANIFLLSHKGSEHF